MGGNVGGLCVEVVKDCVCEKSCVFPYAFLCSLCSFFIGYSVANICLFRISSSFFIMLEIPFHICNSF
ncbi:hypothetical protein Lalb_Chr09g0333201 [Lupinus albus]|uniref:Uncharacterized protein n=1 Tax=Lupinus albus TaxID=3870 RepID=A0A6A4Q2I7_LUPAL|nr:hypothetical protein Lalb_Chr09g0333201 [Lupinus albus]